VIINHIRKLSLLPLLLLDLVLAAMTTLGVAIAPAARPLRAAAAAVLVSARWRFHASIMNFTRGRFP
jgi:hypothetical protein